MTKKGGPSPGIPRGEKSSEAAKMDVGCQEMQMESPPAAFPQTRNPPGGPLVCGTGHFETEKATASTEAPESR